MDAVRLGRAMRGRCRGAVGQQRQNPDFMRGLPGMRCSGMMCGGCGGVKRDVAEQLEGEAQRLGQQRQR